MDRARVVEKKTRGRALLFSAALWCLMVDRASSVVVDVINAVYKYRPGVFGRRARRKEGADIPPSSFVRWLFLLPLTADDTPYWTHNSKIEAKQITINTHIERERESTYISFHSFVDTRAGKRNVFVTSFVNHETANCRKQEKHMCVHRRYILVLPFKFNQVLLHCLP